MELNIGVLSKVVVAALVEQYGSKYAVQAAVAEQLGTSLYTQETIDELKRSTDIEAAAARRTIVELRERVHQLETMVRSVPIVNRSVELTNGMIVDTPRGKARVVIVDAAA